MEANEKIQQAAEMINSARSLLVLTGAGISAESNIPTYRGPGGIYTDSPELEHVLTRENLKEDPGAIWEHINKTRMLIAASAPNQAHEILVKWEKKEWFEKYLVATQNVDGFHRDAGNKKLTELHGNIWELAVPKQQELTEDEGFSDEVQNYFRGNNREELRKKWSHENNHVIWENRDVPFSSIPPHPEDPDVRPNVLLFNEGFGTRLLWVEHFIKDGCDAVILIGCSGGVTTLERLLKDVHHHNQNCGIININPFEDCIETEHVYLKYNAIEALTLIDALIDPDTVPF